MQATATRPFIDDIQTGKFEEFKLPVRQRFTHSHTPVIRFVSLSTSIHQQQPCQIIIKNQIVRSPKKKKKSWLKSLTSQVRLLSITVIKQAEIVKGVIANVITDSLDQALANYGLGSIWGGLSLLIHPPGFLQKSISIVSHKKMISSIYFCVLSIILRESKILKMPLFAVNLFWFKLHLFYISHYIWYIFFPYNWGHKNTICCCGLCQMLDSIMASPVKNFSHLWPKHTTYPC